MRLYLISQLAIIPILNFRKHFIIKSIVSLSPIKNILLSTLFYSLKNSLLTTALWYMGIY